MSDERVARYEALIARHLPFYEDLHYGRRRAKTKAQRRFQDVARELVPPEGEHELAYVWYLAQNGRLASQRPKPPERDIRDDMGLRPVPAEIGRKWDAAAENMNDWIPGRD